MTTNRSTEVKILVTGANGQLGRSLQKISPDYPQYEYLFTDMPEVDITDKAHVSRLVKEQGIDLIVNCAAYTAVDRRRANRNSPSGSTPSARLFWPRLPLKTTSG